MPPSDRWEAVVTALQAYAAEATTDQMALAAHLGYRLDARLPCVVAAALLRGRLRDTLQLERARPATDGQLEYVVDLAREVDQAILTPLDDREMVDAWVKVFHALRAIAALRDLRPCPGDIVETAGTFGPTLAEISSISSDGRLNFMGGNGAGQRPHLVTIRARASNPGPDYDEARYKAQQAAALRRDPSQKVSEADLRDLRRWFARGRPSLADAAALTDALAKAADERPLQAILQKHPQVLAHLVMRHHGGYVASQVRLGAHYVADFILAGMTSLGLRWTLVELESPTAPLVQRDRQPSKQLRKGIQQITDWREWLQENLDQARKARRHQGLGLHGIRPDPRGLVIVGRGALTAETDPLRSQIWEKHRIDVRTYDWLVREATIDRPFGGVLDLEDDTGDAEPF